MKQITLSENTISSLRMTKPRSAATTGRKDKHLSLSIKPRFSPYLCSVIIILSLIHSGCSAIITVQKNYGNDNWGSGKQNHFQGTGNSWVGDYNQIDGHHNELQGNANLVKGDVNRIEGDGNTVKGDGNVVISSTDQKRSPKQENLSQMKTAEGQSVKKQHNQQPADKNTSESLKDEKQPLRDHQQLSSTIEEEAGTVDIGQIKEFSVDSRKVSGNSVDENLKSAHERQLHRIGIDYSHEDLRK